MANGGQALQVISRILDAATGGEAARIDLANQLRQAREGEDFQRAIQMAQLQAQLRGGLEEQRFAREAPLRLGIETEREAGRNLRALQERRRKRRTARQAETGRMTRSREAESGRMEREEARRPEREALMDLRRAQADKARRPSAATTRGARENFEDFKNEVDEQTRLILPRNAMGRTLAPTPESDLEALNRVLDRNFGVRFEELGLAPGASLIDIFNAARMKRREAPSADIGAGAEGALARARAAAGLP